jgi:hypothetical protein
VAGALGEDGDGSDASSAERAAAHSEADEGDAVLEGSDAEVDQEGVAEGGDTITVK